jgi:hypothetical protein
MGVTYQDLHKLKTFKISHTEANLQFTAPLHRKGLVNYTSPLLG